MKKTLFLTASLLPFFSYIPVNAAEDTYISETAYNACLQYGEEYGICPELLMAIIEKESSGQADAENNGCMGLMQINVKFHTDRMERLECTDILDEEQNIHIATDYLSQLIKIYEDIYLVLMAYNMGEFNAEKLYEKGIYESDYAIEICVRAEELERIHGK